VPEQLRLEKALGEGGTVDLDERHVAFGTAGVDRTGSQLLSGARLAGDEDRAAGPGHALEGPDHLLDGTASADDAVVIELLLPLAQEVAVLAPEALVLDGASNRHEELVHLERLLQVVVGPELHGLDGVVDGGVGGHQNDLGALPFRRRLDEVPYELEARLVGHAVVDDEHVEGALSQEPLSLKRPGGRDDLMPLFFEGTSEGLEDALLVVDEENGASRRCGHEPPPEPGMGATGRSISNRVPSAWRLSARITPPSASTTLRAMARPRPVPVRFVLK